MDFAVLRTALMSRGYARRAAEAKIAHDVVLKAVESSGFHDNLTVKGGVVMSGLTDLARRATMDMDVDFIHHSLGEASVRRFVVRLNRHSDCTISIDGEIVDLRHQDYRGKRMHLLVTDEKGVSLRTKVDVGVHTYDNVRQHDYDFRVVTSPEVVRLLVNPVEQIFAEKLKSLLKIGFVTTRFKDIYDLYYLSSRVRKTALKQCLRLFVFDDVRMSEKTVDDIVRRLERIFANRTFMRRLANPNVAWLDVAPDAVARQLLGFVASMSGTRKKAAGGSS